MATKVEQEYENTIELYLDNGYQIVSQTDNSTIMLSDDIELARKDIRFAHAVMGVGSVIASGQRTNSSVLSMDTNIAAASVQGVDFQVNIRITKTGKLQVSGYTLETHKKNKSVRDKLSNKSKKGAYVGGIIILIFSLLLMVFLLSVGGAIMIWLPIIGIIGGILLMVYGKSGQR